MDNAFRIKYVNPYYGELMNLNFLRKPESVSLELFKQIRKIGNELDDRQIVSLFNEDWRAAKVGAWTIGLNKRFDLMQHLGKQSIAGSHYNEHILLNLYILEQEKAAERISKFVENQVRYYLAVSNLIDLERYSIEWGISILGQIDEASNASHVYELKSQKWWQEFDDKIQSLPYYDQLKKSFAREYYEHDIALLMERLSKV